MTALFTVNVGIPRSCRSARVEKGRPGTGLSSAPARQLEGGSDYRGLGILGTHGPYPPLTAQAGTFLQYL